MSPREPQLDLFAAAQPATEPNPVLAELRARLPKALHLGTCSWTFDGWRGEVFHQTYSSKKAFTQNSLEEYASYPLFSTVEIDSTYYAPASATRLRDYAELLPESFPCAMKAWQEITTMVFPSHARFGERAGMRNPHFLDADAFSEHVIAPIESGFAAHIGPVLLCIPPSKGKVDPAVFEKRLAHFLARAPSGYQYAVELRDKTLFTRRYLQVLADHGASHIFNYWSHMPSLAEQWKLASAVLGPVVILRLMLPPRANYAELKAAYAPFDRIVAAQPEMRTEACRMIQDSLERSLPVYVYANNKAEGSAPLTLRSIAEELVGV